MTNDKLGLTATLQQTVTESMLADHVGSGTVPVFATPQLILLLEKTAVVALKELLPPEQTSVGVALNVEHLAATPPGMMVTATATLTRIEGRRLFFDLFAEDEVETIARGSHIRFMVDAVKFSQKVHNKSK